MMHQSPGDEPETVNLLDPDVPLDDRVKLSPAARKRLADKGLQFEVPPDPLVVVMLDDFQHTEQYPICSDESCICHALEYERLEEETSKPRRKQRKVLVRATYEPPRGDLGMVSRPFKLMR